MWGYYDCGEVVVAVPHLGIAGEKLGGKTWLDSCYIFSI